MLKYRATISTICAGDSALENEADVIAAYPELSRAKDKIQSLQLIRCQLQRMEASPSNASEIQRNMEMAQCKKRVALLIEEINQLIKQAEAKTQLAQHL